VFSVLHVATLPCGIKTSQLDTVNAINSRHMLTTGTRVWYVQTLLDELGRGAEIAKPDIARPDDAAPD